MDGRQERQRRLADLASESANATDAMLDRELKALREATRVELDQLRPKVSDTAAYEGLIAVVEDSTRKNESVALLKLRIEALGKEAVGIAKKVTGLLG